MDLVDPNRFHSTAAPHLDLPSHSIKKKKTTQSRSPASPTHQSLVQPPPPPPPPPGMMTAQPLELMDELVEEVLLRVPPDDPTLLLHAALVCKRWCLLVAGRGFRRRYHERHGRPPVLGLIYNMVGINCPGGARFFATSSFHPPRIDLRNWQVRHSGHGRVLLSKSPWGNDRAKNRLLVWDPITGEQRKLPRLSWCPYPSTGSCNAVVLCASSAGGNCNHIDCHRGPFLVLFVGKYFANMVACVYSSEAGAWSEQTIMQEPSEECYLSTQIHAVVGNAFYFKYIWSKRLLKFDLTTREMSSIFLPAGSSQQSIALIAMEDGRLGFANISRSRLYLSTREVGPDTKEKWVISRVIELKALLPADAFSESPIVVAVAEVAGIIFIRTIVGFFTYDLNSGQTKKLRVDHAYALAAANTDEGFGISTSST